MVLKNPNLIHSSYFQHPLTLLTILTIFLSVSLLEEAVKMVSECGSDGSIAVKHGSPVAWRLNRMLDSVAAINGGAVFRRRIPLFYYI